MNKKRPINIIIKVDDLRPEIKKRGEELAKEIKPEYRHIFERQAYITACKEVLMDEPYKNKF